MKKLISTLIFLFLILPNVSFSQQIEKVIELPGQKKDIIFDKAMNWFYDSFVSGKVIEFKDQPQGKIIGNILVPYVIVIAPVNMDTKVTIDVKDNKIRITLTAIRVNTYPTSVGTRSYTDDDLERAKPEYEKIIENFEIYVKSKSKDW